MEMPDNKSYCEQVILCKGERVGITEDSQDPYIPIFQGAGYSCRLLTSLSFSFVNVDKLKDCLKRPQSYSGLILTSQRSVEALKNTGLIQNKYWQEGPTYCVGTATESLAKNHLNLSNCLGSESGNAQQLAKFIISQYRIGDKPLLYPCSNIARETIQQMLEDAGVNIEKIVAYHTLPSPTLEIDLLSLFELPHSQIVVFFSPSIVKHIASIAKKHNLLSKMKPVAIGPVTAEAMKNLALQVYAIAAKPDPVTLLKAICNAQIEIPCQQ